MTSTQSQTLIHAPCGPIQGFEEASVYRYTGIPYAKAERFQAPVPIPPWTETFNATTPGPACPQPEDKAAGLLLKTELLAGLKIDEHCQNLSVTVPKDLGTIEKLSVLVWYHGGAFINGAGDAPIYHPGRLVSENRVIVVNVTSRLAVLGYLGDGKTRPANLGLLDVMQSLRWVKANIAAFGGNDDPKSITIFGQSAGGSTVSDIMAADEAASLFGRVIVQSAPFGITRGRAAMNTALFEHVKHASPDLSVDEIVELSHKVMVEGRKHGNMGGMPFAPQYGFAPLPSEEKLDATYGTSAKHFDILVGHTEEEGSMFVGFIPVIDKITRIPLLGSLVHRTFVSWVTHMLYAVGAKSFVQRHAAGGGTASFYTISWGSKNPRIGSMHAIELVLLFGEEKTWHGSSFLEGRTWEQVDQDGKKLRKIWADFAMGKSIDKQDSVSGIIKIA